MGNSVISKLLRSTARGRSPNRELHPWWHRCRNELFSRQDDQPLETAGRMARRIGQIACGPRRRDPFPSPTAPRPEASSPTNARSTAAGRHGCRRPCGGCTLPGNGCSSNTPGGRWKWRTAAPASWTQSLLDWIGSHVPTLEFLGGVPRQIVPDYVPRHISRTTCARAGSRSIPAQPPARLSSRCWGYSPSLRPTCARNVKPRELLQLRRAVFTGGESRRLPADIARRLGIGRASIYRVLGEKNAV